MDLQPLLLAAHFPKINMLLRSLLITSLVAISIAANVVHRRDVPAGAVDRVHAPNALASPTARTRRKSKRKQSSWADILWAGMSYRGAGYMGRV